jgi:chorismate dehydratase
LPASPFRIGEIPYLNSVPFYWDKSVPSNSGLEWVSVPPKTMGHLAREGRIDAGPLSLIDAFSLEDSFEPLGGPSGDCGIAVRRAAKSVLLFSQVPAGQLSGRKIGVTPDTATSVELLRVLLETRAGVSPLYHEGFQPDDAARLLIGNEALRGAVDPELRRAYPVILDLGEEWSLWQNRPFVFARWVVRKNVAPEQKSLLSSVLDRNLKADLSTLSRAAALPSSLPGWTPDQALEYWEAFRFRLGNAEREAISSFRRLAESLPKR